MKTYRNIIVNALVNLGDVILTTSAVALLKKAYPDARITMLVKQVERQAVVNNPFIDDVIVFDYKAKSNSFRQMLDMAHEIRDRHFDISFSFDRKLRPAILMFLAGVPVRVGADRIFDDKPSHVTWLYTKTVHIPHDLENTLQAETYQEIVRQYTGIKDHAQPVFADTTPENDAHVDELFASLPKAEHYIALCVKGTFELKTWPKEYFVEVVKALADKYNVSFFITGAPGDKSYVDEVIADMPVPVANFCGHTSLTDLAAIFKRVDLFVTVDTGATHIAATTGVPMVTMYGCTSPKRWHPINKNAFVFTSEEPCCPCKYRAEECPSNPKPNCLWHVKPEAVIKKCEEMLDEAGAVKE